MDNKNVIFNAARDGRLDQLKVYLDHEPKEKISSLVSARTNGATPLVIACRNGHLDVANYLIKRWHADVEQVGLVTFHGKRRNVTPIWCAASAGHLNIVEMLVKCNASVNSTSKANWTALYAACFDGHLNIVKYLIHHGADIEIATKSDNTCVMVACYKRYCKILKFLLECGADMNRKNFKGNTALHTCVKSGTLDIIKILLQSGAKFDYDSCGTTPLLLAAVTGHSEIVDYFINKFSCTKQEKVNALELLGATFLDEKHDKVEALKYWKRAMEIRFEDRESPLEKPFTRSPIASYIDATEVRTFHELEELIFDPEKMKIQSLLVRERILGPNHPANVKYIRYVGLECAATGNFDRCIQFWMYALDVLQKIKEPLSTITYSSLFAFTALFASVMTENLLLPRVLPSISFKDILHVFQRALKEIETALNVSTIQKDINDTSPFHRILIITMQLLFIMCWLQPHLNSDEDTELKRAAHKLVYLNPKAKNGWTPLHLACLRESSSLGRYPVFTFPSPEIVDLLLAVGACPNVFDLDNNTPLHITAMNRPCATAIFKALLNHGAHLDLCNYKKKTPLQLAETTLFSDFYPLRYINLQCLCAQIIRKHQIAYEGFVHETLKEFLDSH